MASSFSLTCDCPPGAQHPALRGAPAEHAQNYEPKLARLLARQILHAIDRIEDNWLLEDATSEAPVRLEFDELMQ